MNRVALHTQHSGRYHAAEKCILSVKTGGQYREVGRKEGLAINETLDFPAVSAQDWRVALKAGSSNLVVVRGIRFFLQGKPIFP